MTIKSGATGWKVVDDPSVHNDRAMAVAGAVRMTNTRSSNYLDWVKQQVTRRKSNEDITLEELRERANRAFWREQEQYFMD